MLTAPTRAPRSGLALIAGLGLGCAPLRYTESFTPEEAVTAVRVEADDGTVEMVSADTLRVTRAIRAPSQALDLSHAVVDGVLVLRARCTTLIPCAVDTRVDVPEGLPVTVALADGEVWATGISDLTLSLGEGEADLDVHGRLVAQVGAGDVRGRVDAGAQVRVTVGQGDIDLQVPSGPWRIDATAGRLSVTGVQPDDHAAGSLTLIAPSGRVRLRGEHPLAAR